MKQPKNLDLRNEADIGSGEKSPGQEDTEKMIEQIGKRDDGQQQQRNDAAKPGQAGQQPAAPDSTGGR